MAVLGAFFLLSLFKAKSGGKILLFSIITYLCTYKTFHFVRP